MRALHEFTVSPASNTADRRPKSKDFVTFTVDIRPLHVQTQMQDCILCSYVVAVSSLSSAWFKLI